MQAVMNMTTNQMIIIFPTALVIMYFVVSLQNSLSSKESKLPGLIIPILCFVVATILAIRPLLMADPEDYDGLGMFCLRMWLTFNIPTIVFMFPYLVQRRRLKIAHLQQEAMDRNAEVPISERPAAEQSVVKTGSPETAE